VSTAAKLSSLAVNTMPQEERPIALKHCESLYGDAGVLELHGNAKCKVQFTIDSKYTAIVRLTESSSDMISSPPPAHPSSQLASLS
jgi:hypothetical protein